MAHVGKLLYRLKDWRLTQLSVLVIKVSFLLDLRASVLKFLHIFLLWDHPSKTSALFKGGGVKNLPNLPTDSSKKLPTIGG